MRLNILLDVKIFLLTRIKKLLKSIKKREKKITNHIKFLIWKRKNLDTKFFSSKDFLNSNKNLPKKLAVCVCFYYKESKFQYLKEVCNNLVQLADRVDITIITNENNEDRIKFLRENLNSILKNFNVYSVQELHHPYLLPWAHYAVMRKKILDDSFTHFMYTEDDILTSKENIIYWIKAREVLKKFKLIPSFLRIEQNLLNKNFYSTDIMKKMDFKKIPKVFSEDKSLAFSNVLNPYSAIYFLDRELMLEHLNSPSSSPDFGFFNQEIRDAFPIRERAALALMYYNVPEGFLNRYVIPVNAKNKAIYEYCFLKHLPNNYANDPSKQIAKIKVNEIFY